VSWRQLLMNCVVLRFRSVLWLVCGWWPLAPSLPHSLPFCLSHSVRHNGVHGIAGSLGHVIATFVMSRLVSNRVSSSSSPQSLYVSFFSLAAKYVWNTSAPPPPLLPSRTFCTRPLRLEEKKEKACPVLRSASPCVCASRCSSSHLESGISMQRVLLRERERARGPQNALSAFVCALCVKIVYELGGRGYKGVLSSVVVHLLAFVGFQFLERETERTRARSLQPYSSVIILCSSRFFQVERSESASFRSVARK
jgi:hypothetical protein